jgi:MoxR-like ATPase
MSDFDPVVEAKHILDAWSSLNKQEFRNADIFAVVDYIDALVDALRQASDAMNAMLNEESDFDPIILQHNIRHLLEG